VLEQTGGEYALDKIRQVFPTYESQVWMHSTVLNDSIQIWHWIELDVFAENWLVGSRRTCAMVDDVARSQESANRILAWLLGVIPRPASRIHFCQMQQSTQNHC
jgi:hypothetical protein